MNLSNYNILNKGQGLYRFASYLLFLCTFSCILFLLFNNFFARVAPSLRSSEAVSQDGDDLSDDLVENKLNVQVILGRGETLSGALKKYNIAHVDIIKVEGLLKNNNLHKKILPGSRVSLDLLKNSEEKDGFSLINASVYNIDNLSSIRIVKNDAEFLVEEVLSS